MERDRSLALGFLPILSLIKGVEDGSLFRAAGFVIIIVIIT